MKGNTKMARRITTATTILMFITVMMIGIAAERQLFPNADWAFGITWYIGTALIAMMIAALVQEALKDTLNIRDDHDD